MVREAPKRSSRRVAAKELEKEKETKAEEEERENDSPAEEFRFKHLLEPIRDLAVNWNVDIARDLEGYLGELEVLEISLDGGSNLLNFAEAALLIQVHRPKPDPGRRRGAEPYSRARHATPTPPCLRRARPASTPKKSSICTSLCSMCSPSSRTRSSACSVQTRTKVPSTPALSPANPPWARGALYPPALTHLSPLVCSRGRLRP